MENTCIILNNSFWKVSDPSIVCDWNDNGVFVMVMPECNEGIVHSILWKYNFSSKLWTQLSTLKNIMFPKVILLDYPMLLIAGTQIVPNKAMFFLYNVNSNISTILHTIPCVSSEYVIGAMNKQENFVYCVTSGQTHSGLYVLDLVSPTFQKVVDLPSYFFTAKMLHYENKLFFFHFFYNCQITKPIPYYDTILQQMSEMQPLGNMPNLLSSPTSWNEAIFLNKNKEIWLLNLPALKWLKVSVLSYPHRNFDSQWIVTNDHQMYIFSRCGISNVDLANQPRLLQNICWDLIVNHSRSHPLKFYADSQLHDWGIPKKFRQKLYW